MFSLVTCKKWYKSYNKFWLVGSIIITLILIIVAVNWPPFRDKKLLIAVKQGRASDVKLWLKLGANIEANGYPGMTPLMFATQKGYLDTVIVLLDNGANINSIGHMDLTPLMLAAREGNFNIVKVLVDRKADLNRKDYNPECYL